jgi:hypothetical protein
MIAVVWRGFAFSSLLLFACSHPAAMRAASPPVRPQVGPAAPPEPPVRVAAAPARVVEAPPFEIESVLAAIEQYGVQRLESTRRALYVEHAAGRSLCLHDTGSAPRCFRWPDAYPAPFHIERWNDGDATDVWFDEADVSNVSRVSAAGEGLSVRLERFDRGRRDLDSLLPPSRRAGVRVKLGRKPKPRTGAPTEPTRDPAAEALVEALRSVQPEVGDIMVHVLARGVERISLTYRVAGGATEAGWFCLHADDAPRVCRSAFVQDFAPLRPQPEGWLFLGRSYDVHGETDSLLWLERKNGELAMAALQVGELRGSGEKCAHGRGDCVNVEGTRTAFALLSPTCVMIGETTRWSATHVRMPDRWDDETALAVPAGFEPAPGTYVPSTQGWQRAPCQARGPDMRQASLLSRLVGE